MADETDDTDFDKALGQFRFKLNDIMYPLRKYGQAIYVDSAMLEIESLAIQLHERLSGVDRPYQVNHHNLHSEW